VYIWIYYYIVFCSAYRKKKIKQKQYKIFEKSSVDRKLKIDFNPNRCCLSQINYYKILYILLFIKKLLFHSFLVKTFFEIYA